MNKKQQDSNKQKAKKYLNLGIAKYNSGKHKEAIKDYDKAIRLYKKCEQTTEIKLNLSATYYNRGIAKAKLGKHKEAIKDYIQAIRLYKKCEQTTENIAVAYYNRGFAKAELGEHKEAIKDYVQAIRLYKKCEQTTEIKHNLSETYCNRGVAKAELGAYKTNIGDDGKDNYYKEAIVDYDKAIEFKLDFAVAYYNRGIAKAELGRHKEAILDYNKEIRLYKKCEQTTEIKYNLATAYRNRGIVKVKLGKYKNIGDDGKDNYYKEAIVDYDKAIEFKFDFTEAYNNRGVTKAGLGRYKEAILDYNKEIRLYKKCEQTTEIKLNLATAYSNRGVAKADLGEHKEAIKDYVQAIRLYKKCEQTTEIKLNLSAAYYNRGIVKAKLGKHKEVIADFYKVIKYSKQQPNKTLYQYAPIDNKKLSALINNELYFADYSKLNDPFECYFMQKSWINDCLKEEEITTRILALTFNNTSHAMYSHYADSHKGICVEYEINFDELSKEKEISYGEVQYDIKDKIENLADLYMLKTPEWKYEKEYRLVRFDNKESMPCEIISITFALKCDSKHKKIVYNLMKYKKEIKFYEVIEAKDKKNDFEINEITPKQIKELEIKKYKELYKLMLKHKFER